VIAVVSVIAIVPLTVIAIVSVIAVVIVTVVAVVSVAVVVIVVIVLRDCGAHKKRASADHRGVCAIGKTITELSPHAEGSELIAYSPTEPFGS